MLDVRALSAVSVVLFALTICALFALAVGALVLAVYPLSCVAPFFFFKDLASACPRDCK